MAALAGIADWVRPAAASRATLDAMLRAIAHRGAGAPELRFEGAVGLGRSALAFEGSELQPLASPHGRYLLALDGALANADELRHSYAHEYPFDGRTDAEVLLAALALDGANALPRFSGMFAFVFWDRERQRGLAARDRLGVKPLWYAREELQLRFASEPKALLAARTAPPELDLDALVDWAIAPRLAGMRSPFRGIEALPPGGLLAFDREGTRISRWGRFVPARSVVAEATLLDDATRRVYVGTNTVASSSFATGVWLSGGFDSSLIAGAARFSCDELKAFTLAPAPQSAAELVQAEELQHELIALEQGSLAADLEHLARADDLVPAFEGQRSMRQLARASSGEVQVALAGHGVEELHFGDPLLLDRNATASPLALVTKMGAPERARMLHPDLRGDRPVEAFAERLAWTGPNAAVSLLVERQLARKLHALDLHAAEAGIQLRLPFASNELIEFAERVAPEVGLKNGINKWHLREALGGEVAADVRWRAHAPMTIGEGAEPVYRSEAVRLLSSPPPLVARMLDVPFVLELARAPRALTRPEREMLFQAISLSHWAHHRGLR